MKRELNDVKITRRERPRPTVRKIIPPTPLILFSPALQFQLQLLHHSSSPLHLLKRAKISTTTVHRAKLNFHFISLLALSSSIDIGRIPETHNLAKRRLDTTNCKQSLESYFYQMTITIASFLSFQIHLDFALLFLDRFPNPPRRASESENLIILFLVSHILEICCISNDRCRF